MVAKTKKTATVQITAPNFQYAKFTLIGTSPYLSNKFQNRDGFIAAYAEGSKRNVRRSREGTDFDATWPRSVHWSTDGWAGLPANMFRNAMVSACKLCGFKMTLAKLSIFTEADGYDNEEHTPLIRITKGEFQKNVSMTRNADGSPNVLARGLLPEGWEASITVRFDADQFSQQDIANLLSRVGMQVGIGAGRADSKTSCGIGMGHFKLGD